MDKEKGCMEFNCFEYKEEFVVDVCYVVEEEWGLYEFCYIWLCIVVI